MLVAFAIGSAAGVVYLKDDEVVVGGSHRAERVLAHEFPTERAAEQVLIQSRSGRLGRAELRAATDELAGRRSRVRAVAAIESPLEPANAGQLSRDGRSALLTFQLKGDPDTASDRVGPALAATAAVQRAHPACSLARSARPQPKRPSATASPPTSSPPRSPRSR